MKVLYGHCICNPDIKMEIRPIKTQELKSESDPAIDFLVFSILDLAASTLA